jgi:hypothetical protein
VHFEITLQGLLVIGGIIIHAVSHGAYIGIHTMPTMCFISAFDLSVPNNIKHRVKVYSVIVA